MSAKLSIAYNANRIVVKKLVAGEVMIKFHSMYHVPDLILSNDREIDLLARKGITIDAIKKSNLTNLLSSGYLELV